MDEYPARAAIKILIYFDPMMLWLRELFEIIVSQSIDDIDWTATRPLQSSFMRMRYK